VLQRGLLLLDNTLRGSEGRDVGDGTLELARRLGEGGFALLVDRDKLGVGSAGDGGQLSQRRESGDSSSLIGGGQLLLQLLDTAPRLLGGRFGSGELLLELDDLLLRLGELGLELLSATGARLRGVAVVPARGGECQRLLLPYAEQRCDVLRDEIHLSLEGCRGPRLLLQGIRGLPSLLANNRELRLDGTFLDDERLVSRAGEVKVAVELVDGSLEVGDDGVLLLDGLFVGAVGVREAGERSFGADTGRARPTSWRW